MSDVVYGLEGRIDPYGTGYEATKAELIAKGYTYERVPMDPSIVKMLEARTHPRHNTYDALNEGQDNSSTEGLVLVERSKRSDAEEDYLTALYDVFHAALQRITPSHQLYLRGIMDGKSTREHGAELGISFQAVAQGRTRALNALAKALGAEGLKDRRGIRQGIVRGTNFNITEWLPGFTEGKV